MIPSGAPNSAVYTDLVTFTFNGPAQHGERPLYIDADNPSQALNAGQFKLLVRTLIAGLKAHNVQQGDCVLVHMQNNVVYPALFLAIAGAGGVYMGSNPACQPFDLENTLDLAEPRMIISCRDALSTVIDVSSRRGIRPDQVLLLEESDINSAINYVRNPTEKTTPAGFSGGHHRSFHELLCCGQSNWVTFDDDSASRRTPAAMFSTSGTGGLPKAAVLSHHALISWHLAVYYEVPYDVSRLIAIPMFHNFSAIWTHFFPVRYGHPLFILPEFKLSSFLEAMAKYKVTETYLVPVMVHMLNQCSLPMKDSLSSLRYVGTAGAPIDRQSLQTFQGLLHNDGCAAQMWGMTEVGITFQNQYALPHAQYDKGSVGKLLPGYEARLISPDNGRIILDDDCPGELEMRGPGLLVAYKGRGDAKSEDGWFPTGDVAVFNNGHYSIVGRTKELIKVRGWQVAPAELEAVLLKHPQIRDVAVIGVTLPDDSTEAPRAYVVLSTTTGPKLTTHEVYEYAQRQLSGYKALDGGVVIVDQIPRTASGKIQRYKLSNMNSLRDRMASILSRASTQRHRTSMPLALGLTPAAA